MKRLIALGVCFIVAAELLVLVVHDRPLVLVASGIALGLVLLNVRRLLGQGIEPAADLDHDDLGDSLRRWLATTETTIRWSESTRTDWDRHLRPMLARRYEIATGQRLAKDPAAFQSTGRMLFGAELWEWVNPNNIARSADHEPGPGRAAFEEILRRLEQV
ncbi:hypothetical protein BN1232_01585 [Mycobacterium lentiflavum]|uniref:Uncharacterized protein n=1 Tax=Mycobacterium lentiflavum TaxID=141349 RepID=A0A0E4GW87_MYCLN|nr:hypothetical protein [Mycobacterium lentiflavum]MEE3067000.1 hypothetical protein [Actinomycetota bacterium]ULP43707.1 hypothetical protein MJO58_07025 [Mycobacterium lentiflavum]CQD08783.1 hypothetical protein BN1232_01585 [Mycobacterium lentiflavum]